MFNFIKKWCEKIRSRNSLRRAGFSDGLYGELDYDGCVEYSDEKIYLKAYKRGQKELLRIEKRNQK